MGINSLFSLIGKDFKILFRSKFSTAMIILIPLLIILLTGFAFNSSNLSGVVIGVYSDSYTNLSENILIEFNDQNFVTKKFDSKEECIESVKLSKTQLCTIFPQNLSDNSNLEKIIFYVDHSRINLAYSLVDHIKTKVLMTSSDISLSLTQNLINDLNLAKESLPSQKLKVSDSIGEIGEINNNLEAAFSVSEIDSILIILENAKDSMNSSSAKTKIEESIISLSLVRATLMESSNAFGDQNENVLSSLEEISLELDNLISSLNGVDNLNPEDIVSPITIEIESLNTKDNNQEYLLPTILSLIALFGGILLGTTFVLKERKTKAFFRNFITPTRDFTFIVGTYLTCLIILSLQFILVFVGIEYLLKIPILSLLPEISLLLFVALTGFIFLGMLLGYLFRSEETTIFSSVLIAAGLMFFSNTILPIESFSQAFKLFTGFNPLFVLDLALKKVILFGFNYEFILNELLILGVFAVVFVVLTYISRMITRRKL